MSIKNPAIVLTGLSPHAGQPVLAAGTPLSEAAAVVILLHGRDSKAEDLLTLVGNLAAPGFAFLAPQASGGRWYPNRYDTPLAGNEPALSSAISAVSGLLDLAAQHAIPPERVLVCGFSQGACLTTEFAARNPRRFGGLAILSGGLIGPRDTPRNYPGSLEGTPAFLGCGEPDPFFSSEWIRYSAAVLERMDARIDIRLYPNIGHRINLDMVHTIRRMMANLQV
jgi:predicted esterase